jgi:hypothetical protein
MKKNGFSIWKIARVKVTSRSEVSTRVKVEGALFYYGFQGLGFGISFSKSRTTVARQLLPAGYICLA